MELLYSIDLTLLRAGNTWIANPFFDWFMPFLTDVNNWYAAYIVAWLSLMIFGKRTGRIAALLIIPTIIISDQVSSELLKNLFERTRPCNIVPDLRLILGAIGGYSFPSSHAVNNFAMASLFAHYFPKAKVYLYVFASLVAYTRVYLGLHYPSDIIGGALIGMMIGFGIAYVYDFIEKKLSVNATGRAT